MKVLLLLLLALSPLAAAAHRAAGKARRRRELFQFAVRFGLDYSPTDPVGLIDHTFDLFNLGGLPIEMAFFGDAGVAWTNQDAAHKAWFLGGDRKPIYSTGVALRLNLLGFAVLEVDASHPFNRPGTGIVWQFGLSPGF